MGDVSKGEDILAFWLKEKSQWIFGFTSKILLHRLDSLKILVRNNVSINRVGLIVINTNVIMINGKLKLDCLAAEKFEAAV